MRLPLFLLAPAALAIAGCDRPDETVAPDLANKPVTSAGFQTSRPSLVRSLLSQATLKPILTVGDPLPGQESNPDPEQRVWAPIPDGLGGFLGPDGLVLFANHEIASGGVDGQFAYSKVSRLVIDPATLTVTDGSYAITGKDAGSLFQRLCSATFFGSPEGFAQGWFFTGEESTTGGAQGIQLAVRNDGSEVKQLPWLGRFAHENYIAVPGFAGKTVLVGTDDNSPASLGSSARSELYLYVADNPSGVLAGTGHLYVFASNEKTASGNLTTGESIGGRFVEITDPASLTADQLQARVDELGAFKFVRLEDADYARDGGAPRIYFVDTGNSNALCNGQVCDLFGSIYRMDFNAANPTITPRLTLLARSRGVAAGDWASPDNIAVGRHSLMLQEDPAYAGFNRPERMWNFKFRENGDLGEPRAVAELETEKFTGNICSDAAGTCWETSGVIDASPWLGDGTWLFDVQAHTLPFSYEGASGTVEISKEGGQLLYLRLPGT
jgi:Bacterial protein of unknown function (DUF839)